MAAYSSREGELLAKLGQSFLILSYIRIYLAVGSFQIGIGNKEVAAVSRSGNINHIQVIFFNGPVHVHIYEILPGNRAPVAYYLFLYMLSLKRFLKQRVVQQVKLCCRKIVGCSPVGVHFFQIIVLQVVFHRFFPPYSLIIVLINQ